MSDCFDHAFDAMESREQAKLWGCSEPSFNRDPLYYHRLLTFKEIKHNTDKAVLIVTEEGEEQWLPLSICKQLKSTSVYVHRATYRSITGEEKLKCHT